MDNINIINKVLLGDIRNVARFIPDNYIQVIVTSPPYFGHRNYTENEGYDEEIGRENTLTDYVKNIVDCFDAIKPKLREDGLLWLNLGDTYRNKELQGVPWRVAMEDVLRTASQPPWRLLYIFNEGRVMLDKNHALVPDK